MNPGVSFSWWWLTAGVVAIFAAGYLAGWNPAPGSPAIGVSGELGTGENGLDSALMMGSAGGELSELTPEQWADFKNRIVARWETSPDSRYDYDLRDETLRLFASVSPSLLEAWFREIRPPEGESSYRDNLQRLILDVLVRHSGEKMVCLLAEKSVVTNLEFEDALSRWSQYDPAAVLVWLGGDIPEALKTDLADYREEALGILAWKDPAAFEHRLGELDQETRESVLGSVAYAARYDPERRARILERVSTSPSEEAKALRRGLLVGLASRDASAAFEILADMELSDSDRKDLDATVTASGADNFQRSKSERPEALQAWMERNPGDDAPDQILRVLNGWWLNDPKELTAWVAGRAPGIRRDAFAGSVVEEQLKVSWPSFAEIATLASSVTSTKLRVDLLRRLKSDWSAKDEGAAAAWEATLPESDRSALK